ncbi:unnamed protein product [Hymenolepis diminuta]|nr:unnamed protein product [Hymenolepis diminuta]
MSVFSATGGFSVKISEVLKESQQAVELKAVEIANGNSFTIKLVLDSKPMDFSSVYGHSSAKQKSFLEQLEEKYKVKDGLTHTKFHIQLPLETENMEPSIQNRHFVIENEVGQGSFGSVFKLKDIVNSHTFAVKCLKDVDPEMIKKEIHILEKMRNSRNVIHFYGAVYIEPLRATCLVMEHINCISLDDILDSLTLEDIRYYSHQLLIAIDECHKRGIIHRDIKPDNILVDPLKRELRLIDFGVADLYDANKPQETDIGTLNFYAPELLMDYKMFDHAIDMWAFGCIFASAVFRRRRLFEGDTFTEVLQDITSVLGSDKLFEYIANYGILMNSIKMTECANYPVQTWDSLITEENSDVATAEALDLVDKLIVFDHKCRLSAEEAMKHPFFNE